MPKLPSPAGVIIVGGATRPCSEVQVYGEKKRPYNCLKTKKYWQIS